MKVVYSYWKRRARAIRKRWTGLFRTKPSRARFNILSYYRDHMLD